MDVAAWLQNLGLERYIPAFRDNEIDERVLPNLTAEDLKDLGVTLVGHRRRLLDAIATFDAEGHATTAAAPHDAPAGAERRQLTVMFCDLVGSTPNLAARLQELAPANAVLVAESTRRLLGDLFDYRDLGAVTVKGLVEPVSCWQVLRESTVENRFEALRTATLSPLIGRDEEVGLLLRRWAWAKDGEGQIVLISGEAGIGKSRIAAVLLGRIEPERPIRMRYFCSPHRRDSALYPFTARLERAAEFGRGDSATTKLDKIAALLSRSGERTPPETIALFADLLGLPSEGRYPPPPTAPRQT